MSKNLYPKFNSGKSQILPSKINGTSYSRAYRELTVHSTPVQQRADGGRGELAWCSTACTKYVNRGES